VSSTPGPSKAAAIQFEPVLFEKEANIRRLLALTEEAAQNGARLIVHPEMATTGYCWQSREEIAPYVEPIPGPTTERVARVAARYNCFIVTGIAEVAPETGIFYNSAALIGPSGLIGVYRKTHSFISEPKWAKDGDLGIPVFETEIGQIAINICQDATFPEPARVAALQGADVICFPTNWLGEKSPSPVWMARAYENGVYFIAANRYGSERGVQFSGGSCVVDPDGVVVSHLDTGDGIIYAEIDVASARSTSRRSGRRPDYYGSLSLSTYLYDPVWFHGLYDLTPLPDGRKTKIAVAQFSPVLGDINANVEKIEAIVDSTSPNAQLLVFPELSLTGAVESVETAVEVAQPLSGNWTDRLKRLSRDYGAYLVVGLVEQGENGLYNTALLIEPEGSFHIYRKVHLSPADEPWALPGDLGFPTFDTEIGRIGLLIGFDVNFPEAARSLAIHGADLIAWPSISARPEVRGWGATLVPHPPQINTGPSDHHFHLWRERSKENCTYVAFASSVNPGTGWSGNFAPFPEGEPADEVLLPGVTEGVAILEMDTTNLDSRYVTNYSRAKDLLGMRMPLWYDVLQTPEEGQGTVKPSARSH
jgi:predicted amidohydrolase